MSERRGVCRFCGRMMVIDDAKRAVHHEAPLCRQFAQVVRTIPPSGTGLSIDAGGEMVEITERRPPGKS